MTSLVGMSGSLRSKSWNTRLLENARDLAPDDVTLSIHSIAEIPLYNQDVEDEGVPRPVANLKDAVAAADGLVISTPEYNHSMPGVLKNTIDWLSRPSSDQARVLHGKPVLLMGTSPSGFGTAMSQTAWLAVFRALRMSLWTGGGMFALPNAPDAFDDDGRLREEQQRERLQAYLRSFADNL